MIVTVVISDRPHDLYLDDCLKNLRNCLPSDMKIHTVDDTAHQLGMAGAVQAGFAWAVNEGADYAFWVEEDFRFDKSIPLFYMTLILDNFPHLAQLVLKRQPWSDAEKQAGGQIETNPDAYKQRGNASMSWIEHSTLFSMNPCLIPRRTLELGWPSGGLGIERDITDACIRAGMRFAYYGRIEDPPRCEHVGHVRSVGHRW